MKRKQRVTLEDVAREAGVSTMTVSRVINNKGRISAETREYVLAIVEKLRYRPNRAARTLVTNKTYIIAFVVPDITNPYFSRLFEGVDDVMRLEDYNVMVANSNEVPSREKAILENLDDSTVDGLVICSSRLSDDDLLPLIARFSSVVAVTRRLPEHLASQVLSDFTPGYRALMGFKYLHELGYKRIGYIALRHYTGVNQNYLRYEVEKMGVHLNEEWITSCAPKWKAGYDTGYEFLKRNPEVEAIVGGNDLVALGVMRAAIDLGRKIPDDLGIIGADDILMASQVTPALTTLRTNSYEMGKMAAELLLKRMAGDANYHESVYRTELVIRDSTRKIDNNRLGDT